MNAKSLLAGFTLLVLFSATAGAAVISRDWKTPGDGLLTYDTVSGREWLDLSVTNLDNFALPSLDNALEELEPGGMFGDFTLAHSNDVLQLSTSAGIDISTRNFDINHEATTQLIALLGVTSGDTSGRFASLGFLNELGNTSAV